MALSSEAAAYLQQHSLSYFCPPRASDRPPCPLCAAARTGLSLLLPADLQQRAQPGGPTCSLAALLLDVSVHRRHVERHLAAVAAARLPALYGPDGAATSPAAAACPAHHSLAAAQQHHSRYVRALLRDLSAALRAEPVSLAASVLPALLGAPHGSDGPRYSCGHAALDAVLPLRRGQLLELYGAAGRGKTQLALQCLLQTLAEGLAESRPVCGVYLVSEDVPAARLSPIAAGAVARVRAAKGRAPSVEAVLTRLQIKKIPAFHVLASLFGAQEDALDRVVGGRNGTGLVVLDSVAAAVQGDGVGGRGRDGDRCLQLGALLHSFLAAHPLLHVLVTNQVRAPPADVGGPLQRRRPSAEGAEVPALGLPWAQVPHARVCLRRTARGEGPRQMVLLFSPSDPPGRQYFTITEQGIEGDETLQYA